MSQPSEPDQRDSLVEAPSLHAQIYERLRDEILRGTLASGTRISPAGTARRFGVSVMPVRHALAVLEKDGLVETAARRWTRVVALPPDAVEELVPLVSLLEAYAVAASGEVSEGVLARLRTANKAFGTAIRANDAQGAIAADTEFHDALVALVANRSLERALEDARARIQLLRPQVMRPEESRASLVDHAEIIERLERGDRRGAARVVERNWNRGLARFRAGRG